MKLKNIIPVMVVLLLGSCVKQELDSPSGVPAGAVRINYSLPVATVVETRANADKEVAEQKIETMHVLVFDDAEKFVEMQQARTFDGITSVKLSSSEGATRSVRIVANAQAIIDAAGNVFDPATATWETISSALKLGSIISANPTINDLPTTPLPMFSAAISTSKIEPGVTEIGTVAAPIKLLSGYAKVSLASADNRLTITGIALHNAPAEGGELFGETISSAERRVNYHEAASYSFTQSANYIYPTSTTTHTVDLIVKGHYTGDSEDTFYRIALSAPQADGSRKKFDFLANHHYAVKLTQVGTHGYPTIEEAIANEPSNIIYDIEIGDMTGEVVSNGQYYMSLSTLTYEITGNHTAIKIAELKTNAPTTTNRSAVVVSSISDDADFITDVSLNATGVITATIKDISGSGVVRVTVGNLSQDITITNGQLSLSNQSYEVVAGSEPVTISTLRTNAPSTTKRSAAVVSSIGDGADFITGVSLNEITGVITATTKDIGGGAVVRVTVGNHSQDITITNADKPVTLVDTDEQAFLTATSMGDITCAMTGTLSDKLSTAVDAPTKKVTISRKNVLHDGKEYSGTITVADAKANVSYWVPVALEMYTVNVGGTLSTSTDGVRNFWAGGINWATGNISMPDVSSVRGMVISTDTEHNGMYFKWMTEWGGYSAVPPFSDNSGRTDESVNFLKWADIAVGGSPGAVYVKYDPCVNVAKIPGVSVKDVDDYRKGHWRSPNRAEYDALVLLSSSGLGSDMRMFRNGRLKLFTTHWLNSATLNEIRSTSTGLWIDGDQPSVYRPGPGDFVSDQIVLANGNSGTPVRCVRTNTRTN